MEIVELKNRNREIFDCLSETDKKAFEQHPFIVKKLLNIFRLLLTASSNFNLTT